MGTKKAAYSSFNVGYTNDEQMYAKKEKRTQNVQNIVDKDIRYYCSKNAL